MKRRHIPERTCAGCGSKRKKEELVRFSIQKKDGVFELDEKGCSTGRGIYSCANMECLVELLRRASKGKIRHLRGIDKDRVEVAVRRAMEKLKDDDTKVQR